MWEHSHILGDGYLCPLGIFKIASAMVVAQVCAYPYYCRSNQHLACMLCMLEVRECEWECAVRMGERSDCMQYRLIE